MSELTWLVTGGTGTLGSAVSRKLLSQGHKVRVYSRDEHKHEAFLRSIPEELKENLSTLIGDVRDSGRLRFAAKGVQYVIHAAALKVVPLCEYNPHEAVETNIRGSENVARVVADTGSVISAVLISTDKACHPANLYGATKMAAEKLWIASNRYAPTRNPFSVVRYGNVAGSAGSVWHVLRSCKQSGQLFSLTDINMSRFHIRLNDAVKLVVDVAGRHYGGSTFVPILKSYRVEDLVEAFGVTNLKVTGIRPGEKLHETLVTDDEARYVAEEFEDIGGMQCRVIKPEIQDVEFIGYTSANATLDVGDLKREIREVFGG